MTRKTALKIKVLFLISFLIGPLIISNADINRSDLHLFVKGRLVKEHNYFVEQGRFFLSLPALQELLAYEVNYNESTKVIEIKNGMETMRLKLGGNKAVANGKDKAIDAIPTEKGSHVYIPMRFIADAFDENIEWDGKNKNIILSQYQKPNLKIGEPQDFVIGDHKFSLQLSKDFKNNVGYKIEKDSIIFFDIYNKERSKDNSSGVICRILRSSYPVSLTVPAIVLEFKDGIYIEAVMESGVEYSLEKNAYKERYDKSVNLVEKTLESFKMN